MKNKVILYLISDSVGETAQKIISAVSVQYPDVDLSDIKRFPFTNDVDSLTEILKDALLDKAIVVTTLVNRELVAKVEEFTRRTGLSHVDYMSPLSNLIEAKTGAEPIQSPGAMHRLNEEYFSRVSAIEFAVRYDDGKDPRGFKDADIVLLGVSRTSKTPLSMYLANKKYKVANLPLIPEVPIPKELHEIPAKKIFGLTAQISTLAKIRKSRLAALGLNENSSYSEETRIREELQYAEQLFKELGIEAIAVDNKAIEETATIIEGMLINT